ncbi:FecCD family ABC transporter permease [Flammeovirga kamogawensis]|uniref:Iron ABC transporter permease n=1 Tax=Flammeovirga kamogawensis TaxID=373891 RepID=A0ABX8GY34_9BACT|nr:iron ABC transporter permease [Flammeovirga kamogawensis]MBB6461276.1 iron complex transport system permease protein [Flammeovirga kamogawensis]QWG07835.1 iron ABC transporter permease [Flammeovirga kamogawensis]TRX69640.1 iron ABC transporter permease [Flammeovirga kamogawensis]
MNLKVIDLKVKILLLWVAIIPLFILNVSVGSTQISISDIFSALFHSEIIDEGVYNILWLIRIPKAIVSILAGIGLAVSGLLMQALFRNPMAGPSVLGINSGASLGVALISLSSGIGLGVNSISYLQNLGAWLTVIASSAGAGLVMFLILIVAHKVKDNVALLIVGIMVGALASSLVGIAQYFSHPDQLQEYILWTFGSLGGIVYDQILILSILTFLGILVSIYLCKSMNLMLLGEQYAKSMGLSVSKFRLLTIFSASILAGSITGFCGPIGFVGIAAPHIARVISKTSDHFKLLPLSAVVGAGGLLICDIISHINSSGVVLPINSITSLIGAPIVILAMLKGRK